MDFNSNQPDSPGGLITIVQGYTKQYLVDLFYQDTGAPFDLTNCLEVIAAHPANSGIPVEKKLSTGGVQTLGSPGAGRILVTLTAGDSSLLAINPNPEQPQDLQIVVYNADNTHTPFVLASVLNIILPSYGVI
jgi:hypothetical protein